MAMKTMRQNQPDAQGIGRNSRIYPVQLTDPMMCQHHRNMVLANTILDQYGKISEA
jgi:hypothetical protein